MEEVTKLLSGLIQGIEKNNNIQIEYCSALLKMYINEGVDIYKYCKKEDINFLKEKIEYGNKLFEYRKKKDKIRRLIISIFIGISLFFFSYSYLSLSIYTSILFFIIGTFIDILLKIKINQIAFVVKTKKEYHKYVAGNLLKIRESEDISKLWK